VKTVDRIEELIVTGSEGFFDEPSIRCDLRITIRIARDFYDFLVKSGEQPPAREVAYVMDTIRSGMDQFFALAYLCRVIDTGAETWVFDPHAQWDFPALRERFIRGFEQLAGSPDASAVDRLSSLLALTHLELVFLGQHFPSAILGYAVADPQSTAEFVSDLSEWHAGRISFEDVKARLLARNKGTA
jgi:hypothetical protein